MTRCCKCALNLKSSVYNQTGQSYIEQLALHRSMCVHMQRLIQAKSVVNARNPRYLQGVRRRSCSRPASSVRTHERACSNERCCSPSTENMPCDDERCDVIKVHCRNKSAPPRARSAAASESKSRSCSGERLLVPVTNNCAAKCPCSQQQQQQSSRSRGSGVHNIAYIGQLATNAQKSNVKSRAKAEGSSSPTTSRYNELQPQQLRTKAFNYEKRHFNNDDCCKMDYTAGRSTAGSSKAWRQQQQQQQKLCLCRKCSGGNGARRCRARRRQPDDRELVNEEQERTLRKLLEREEEESCYAKFVYDITQEIVQNGLYSDQELKQVFARHLERGTALQLDRRRMLYEIYQLKISLHMSDSEDGGKEGGQDDEDEEEEGDEKDEEDDAEVYAIKFDQRGSTVPKPPTPPRHLSDANDIVKKIESLRLSTSPRPTLDNNNAPAGGQKSVTLVDANPELFVTEKDVLESLAENDVSPERIQSIYRNLFQRSKTLSPPPANEAAVNSSEKNESRFKKLCRYCNVLSLFHNACERKDSSMSVVAPAGILRKECTDFDAKLGNDPKAATYYRYCFFKEKLDNAVEKCNRWKTDQCHCMTGEDYEATTTVTTRRKASATSPPKIKEQQRMTSAKRKNSPAKTPLKLQQQRPRSPMAATSTMKKEKQSKQQQKQQQQRQQQQQQRRSANATKKPEAAMMPKIFEKTRSVAFGSQPTHEQITSSPESSKRSPRVKETAKESKSPVPTPRTVSSAEGEREPTRKIDTASETNEEIEEDIDEEEQREKSTSPRHRSLSPKIHDKPDDETKEAASPSPRNIDNNNDDDEALSIASAGSSLNYDFSITSDLSLNDKSPAKAKPTKSAKKKEMSNKDAQTRGSHRRTARVQDFIKQFFSKKNSKEAWKISDSSSDTTDSEEVDSASAPWSKKATKRSSPLSRAESINPERTIGSTGEAGLRIISNWKNDFSTNFYAKANASKYCDPGCRRGDEPHCSDNCKFVKSNCRNLSNFTHCLNEAKDENGSETSD